jgi:hypothetical protein
MRQILARLDPPPAPLPATPPALTERVEAPAPTNLPAAGSSGISQPAPDTFSNEGAGTGVAREENAPTRGEDRG